VTPEFIDGWGRRFLFRNKTELIDHETGKIMSDIELKLDKETMQAQRATRNMVKRDTWILILAFFGSLILLFVLKKWFPSITILFLPLLIVFYIVSNWRQWNALIVNQLRCPHCGQLLAEHVNLLWSPSPKCRHCGEIALASIKQLEQDEQSD
jgi:hypothetical protein